MNKRRADLYEQDYAFRGVRAASRRHAGTGHRRRAAGLAYRNGFVYIGDNAVPAP